MSDVQNPEVNLGSLSLMILLGILKKQCSHLRGCHNINSRYKNNILGIPVNNSKDPSEPTLSLRQLENKVHGYLLKRLCWNIQRLQ